MGSSKGHTVMKEFEGVKFSQQTLKDDILGKELSELYDDDYLEGEPEVSYSTLEEEASRGIQPGVNELESSDIGNIRDKPTQREEKVGTENISSKEKDYETYAQEEEYSGCDMCGYGKRFEMYDNIELLKETLAYMAITLTKVEEDAIKGLMKSIGAVTLREARMFQEGMNTKASLVESKTHSALDTIKTLLENFKGNQRLLECNVSTIADISRDIAFTESKISKKIDMMNIIMPQPLPDKSQPNEEPKLTKPQSVNKPEITSKTKRSEKSQTDSIFRKKETSIIADPIPPVNLDIKEKLREKEKEKMSDNKIPQISKDTLSSLFMLADIGADVLFKSFDQLTPECIMEVLSNQFPTHLNEILDKYGDPESAYLSMHEYLLHYISLLK